jgi:hypothetical protein
MVTFKKAERVQAKLRLAITGPSGSGKTFSALCLASGIAKKIAVIDTENHSASLFAGEKGIPSFDTVEIDPPYTIGKYIEAMQAAVDAGYELLIIDSISHAWAGEGGLLSQKEALDGRGGNSYTNWASITKDHEKFKAWLLKVNVHLIVTMRSKQDYVVEQNDKGKSAPRKVGLAPIQREGMEYEFTMVLDMGMNHHASISKTRVNAFDGRVFIPTKAEGKELREWLESGAPAPLPVPTITEQQSKDLLALAKSKGVTSVEIAEKAGVSRMGELTVPQFKDIWARLEAYQPEGGGQTATDASVDTRNAAVTEKLLRAGITMDQINAYCETLPFAGDVAQVVAHLEWKIENIKAGNLVESFTRVISPASAA